MPRRAHDQHPVGEGLALGDDRAGRDQAAPADARAVEHHRPDADQRAIADGAAVQRDLMADRHILADRQRLAHVGVQHAAVLDVAAAPDDDGLVVTPQHGSVPDAAVGLQADLPDDGGTVGHPGTAIDLGNDPIERVNRHGNSPREKP
jgi:hypothetical protein